MIGDEKVQAVALLEILPDPTHGRMGRNYTCDGEILDDFVGSTARVRLKNPQLVRGGHIDLDDPAGDGLPAGPEQLYSAVEWFTELWQ